MFCAKLAMLAERGREVQLRARREVVDDLEHRRAFVAAARLAGQHGHGAEVAERLRSRRWSTPSDSTPIFTPAPLTP